MILQSNPVVDGVILITLIIIFLVFLLFDAFKRKERLEAVAYLAAMLPFAFIWYTNMMPYLGALFIMELLLTLCLCRDIAVTFIFKKKNRDYAVSIVMYGVATGVYFLFAAILPAIAKAAGGGIHVRDDVQNWFNIAYLPEIITPNDLFLYPFRLITTINVFLVIIPFMYEIKKADTHVGIWANILLAVIFTLPTLFLVHLWAQPVYLGGGVFLAFGFLFGVLYFILMIMITRGKK
ncbi:MAG: hypothetical protein ACFFCS_22515 [Candidatus Hodarchaeota archaeon]